MARELRARLPDSHLLILISEESYLTFNPLLPEVVGASIFPEQVVAPLRQMLNLSGASRFIMGMSLRSTGRPRRSPAPRSPVRP